MNTRTVNYCYTGRRNQPRYPNEADKRYFEQKILDIVTSVITGMGVITIFFFLFLM